jgi:hypothetical protein
MMEITSGDENAITIGTIAEILAASKAEIIKDQQSITEETQRKKDEVQAELDSYIKEASAAAELRNDRINNISIIWGRRIVRVIKHQRIMCASTSSPWKKRSDTPNSIP